jgi:NAD(P)H-dependent flavin oxidoreductase YrpB (nitropropane dioxygenase family)
MDWSAVVPFAAACVAGGLISAAIILAGIRLAAGRAERLAGTSPRTSLMELLYVLQAWSLRELALTLRRAQSGKPAEHPMGSFLLGPALLDQLSFDPATLHPRSLPATRDISLAVRIGPAARRPLALALPVLIAPMGYGVGLTADAKLALAQISSLAGTATSSGEGPFLPEERGYAQKWILEWSQGPWNHSPEVVKLADMVAIHIGQGAEAEMTVHKSGHLPKRLTRITGTHHIILHGGVPRRFPGLLSYLRRLNPAIPIGVKIAASQHLESDLQLLTHWGVDFITMDGSEAGSASSPAVITDHFGIPTAQAVVRAREWLDRHPLSAGVSLIASGGLKGAADIAKVLALGADAAEIGSSLLIAIGHEQLNKLAPAYLTQGPSALIFADSPRHAHPSLAVGEAATRGAAWFEATSEELKIILQCLGLDRAQDLKPRHLIARTPEGAALLPRSDSRSAPLAEQLAVLTGEYHRLLDTLRRQSELLSHPREMTAHA